MATYHVEGLDGAEGKVLKNVRFGIAKALTQTAKAASETVTSALPTIFDRPTPFTQRAIGFTGATRDNLQARVFVRDVQAGYLQMQERGGTRAPKPGSPITLPVAQRVNQYGNIARGAIGRARQKPDTFFASGRDANTAHLKPGIYQRPKAGAKRRGKKGGKAKAPGLKLLVAYKRQAQYQPRFQFEGRVVKAANAVLASNIDRNIADALRTMR